MWSHVASIKTPNKKRNIKKRSEVIERIKKKLEHTFQIGLPM